MSATTKKSDTHEERYYFVDIPGHPRVHKATVFFRREPGDSKYNRAPFDIWFWTVSFCSNADVFQKHVGRSHARRRYFELNPNTQFSGAGRFSTADFSDSRLRIAYQGYDYTRPPAFELAQQVALRASKFVV